MFTSPTRGHPCVIEREEIQYFLTNGKKNYLKLGEEIRNEEIRL